MAPFNKRQIGYIQAVAGRQQHVTLRCGQRDAQHNSNDDLSAHQKPQALRKCIGTGQTSPDDDAKSLLMLHWTLDRVVRIHDSRPAHNNATLEAADYSSLTHSEAGFGRINELKVFDALCAENTYTGSGSATEVSASVAFTPVQSDIPSTQRATPDGFLNSTDVRFRFTLPQKTGGTGDVSSLYPTAADLGITNTDGANGITVAEYEQFVQGGALSSVANSIQSLISQYNLKHPMGQDHYEFRWIVWRNKLPTVPWTATNYGNSTNLEAVRDGASFRNPAYDLFMGQTGRKRGFSGYTHHPKLDSNLTVSDPNAEKYSGQYWNGSEFVDGGLPATQPVGEDELTVDDLMTMRLNRDDYVIMKDVRFFLGKEHGKSHFEDTLHWDWNDPIDTPEANVLSSATLNNKNFRWNMTLIGTSGGKSPVILNECVRWTTKMESG